MAETNNRQVYRRKLQQSIDLVETARKYLCEFAEAYVECCPELAQSGYVLDKAGEEYMSAIDNLRSSF